MFAISDVPEFDPWSIVVCAVLLLWMFFLEKDERPRESEYEITRNGPPPMVQCPSCTLLTHRHQDCSHCGYMMADLHRPTSPPPPKKGR